MRVRLTVTLGRLVYHARRTRSVVREAGENPARTRHCHRGSPPQGGDSCRRSLSRHGAAREGAEGRPGSQETSLRPPSRTPSWKGVAPRMKLSLSTGLAAGLLAVAAAPALAAPVTVDLRSRARTRRSSKARSRPTSRPFSHGRRTARVAAPTRPAAQAIDRATVGNSAATWNDGVRQPDVRDDRRRDDVGVRLPVDGPATWPSTTNGVAPRSGCVRRSCRRRPCDSTCCSRCADVRRELLALSGAGDGRRRARPVTLKVTDAATRRRRRAARRSAAGAT